jgi:hypothetical protein
MAQPNSPLLALPAELRNTIYEYVFTEPNKILSHTGGDSNQLKFICHQLKHETRWLELRYNECTTMVREKAKQLKPAQQFITFAKHVSPQALDYLSTVILKDDHETAPDLDASYFAWEDPSNFPIGYVRRLSEPPFVLTELAEMCRAYPHIHIKYIVPGFSLDRNRCDAALQFILQGVFYTHAVRGVMDAEDNGMPTFQLFELDLLILAHKWLEIKILNFDEEIDQGRPRMWYEAIELLSAPNLKFFPTYTSLDETAFRQMILDARTASSTAAAMVNDMVSMDVVDLWTAKARKWVEVGI